MGWACSRCVGRAGKYGQHGNMRACWLAMRSLGLHSIARTGVPHLLTRLPIAHVCDVFAAWLHLLDRRCWATGTQMVMWNGERRAVEKICAGDLLMGPDGRPRTVQPQSHARAKCVTTAAALKVQCCLWVVVHAGAAIWITFSCCSSTSVRPASNMMRASVAATLSCNGRRMPLAIDVDTSL